MKDKRRGFTIIEMIVVMIIISVVLILTMPNIQQKRKIVNKKGCEALIEVINSQILMYELDNDADSVTLDELIDQGYLKESQRSCPGGGKLMIKNGQASLE